MSKSVCPLHGSDSARIAVGSRGWRSEQDVAQCCQHHARVLSGRLRKRLAGCEHEVDSVVRQGRRDQIEVLRCTAEAAKPDRGDPLLHPAARRRDRVLTGRRVGLGLRPAGSQGGRRSRWFSPTALSTRRIRPLYKTFIGLGLRRRKGATPARWVLNNYKGATSQVNIVELAGHDGLVARRSTAKNGFASVHQGQTRSSRSSPRRPVTSPGRAARKSWSAFLKANPKIDLLFAHNDDMGLGAIEAIEAAGLKPGVDIKIVTNRRRPRRHGGAVQGQDQLHRRVQPAALDRS